MTNCRLCQKSKLNTVFKQPPFKINRCHACGFGTLDPIPTAKQLNQIYQGQYHDYISDSEFLADAKHKLNTITPLLQPKDSILDFGCGVGHFLHLAAKQKLIPFGHDISQTAATQAKKKFSLELCTSPANFSTFSQNQFNHIASFDVIEHLPNFQATLKNFHHWLKPQGYLFLTTPSFDTWDAKLLGKSWYGYTRIPQHVNYFDSNSITLSLTKANFNLISIQTFGFVRSIGYLAKQISDQKLLHFALETLHLSTRHLYLPMTDMLIIAQNK